MAQYLLAIQGGMGGPCPEGVEFRHDSLRIIVVAVLTEVLDALRGVYHLPEDSIKPGLFLPKYSLETCSCRRSIKLIDDVLTPMGARRSTSVLPPAWEILLAFELAIMAHIRLRSP